eukprot:m.111785 g.111785  ORF g.111785 m.111785 type:complete len:414 (-) comp17013_c0_seq1:511-1752(-)
MSKDNRVRSAYNKFRHELEICSTLMQMTNTTCREHDRYGPLDFTAAPITEVFHNSDGTNDSRTRAISFKDKLQEGAFFMVLKGNIHSMWVAWEALLDQVHSGVLFDLVDPCTQTRIGHGPEMHNGNVKKLQDTLVEHALAFVCDGGREILIDGKILVDRKILVDGKKPTRILLGEIQLSTLSKALLESDWHPQRSCTKILGNLYDARNALLVGKKGANEIQEDETVHDFQFEIYGGQFKALVFISTLSGVTVFMRFFYGLRNILAHGEYKATLGKCLKEFVTGATINRQTLKESRPKIQKRIATNIADLLKRSNCDCQVDVPLQDKSEVDMTADWMADKITNVLKFTSRTRISTLLLQTMHGFLVALGKAFVDGLIDNCKRIYPGLPVEFLEDQCACTDRCGTKQKDPLARCV